MDETIKKILSLIGKDVELMKAFDKGGFLNLSGLCDEQKGYIAAALAVRVGKKPVIVVPDIARARVMKGGLEAFVSGDVLILAPSELNLVNAMASSRESEMERVGVLSRVVAGDYGALLICASTLINKLPSVAEFKKRISLIKLLLSLLYVCLLWVIRGLQVLKPGVSLLPAATSWMYFLLIVLILCVSVSLMMR